MVEKMGALKKLYEVKKNNIGYAMQDEMKSLHDSHSYDLIKLPKDKRGLENM